MSTHLRVAATVFFRPLARRRRLLLLADGVLAAALTLAAAHFGVSPHSLNNARRTSSWQCSDHCRRHTLMTQGTVAVGLRQRAALTCFAAVWQRSIARVLTEQARSRIRHVRAQSHAVSCLARDRRLQMLPFSACDNALAHAPWRRLQKHREAAQKGHSRVRHFGRVFAFAL